jgi:hypothetical protein
MINKCESHIFRTALELDMNTSMKEGIKKILSSVIVDANILELMGQCLPEVCMSAIIDRAYKNELITQLFPFRVRDRLSHIIRNGGRMAINHLLIIEENYCDDAPTRSSAFEKGEELRARFYELNGLSIVNHTLPDYAACLSRQIATSAASLVVKMLAPRGSCPTEGVDYHNLYDGINPFKIAPRKKTESAYTFISEAFKTMNPIERCIQKAAVISAHISSKGGDGALFWSIVLSLWGCDDSISRPVVTLNIKEGSSFKRISPSTTSRIHPIACFTNVHFCIMVDATSLGKYLSAYSTNTDYMSFVTAARCFGLLEYGCSGIRTDEIPFAILPGCLPSTNSDTLKLTDEEGVHEGMCLIRRNRTTTFQDSVMACLISKEVTADDEELVQEIEYTVGVHKETRTVGRVHVKPGFIRQEVTSGIAVSIPSTSRGPYVKIVGEEIRHRHGVSIQVLFRKLSSRMGPSQALANAIIHVVAQQFKRIIPKKFIVGKWKDMGEIVDSEFPTWPEVWKNICHAARHCKSIMSDDIVDALFRYFDHGVKQTFKLMDPTINEYSSTVLGALYMVSHGRLPTPESYTLTSALGPTHIAKCWRMASTRKRYLSRGSDLNNALMSQIYSGLATQAMAYNPESGTKQTVILGAHQSIVSYLEELKEGSLSDVPEFSTHFLTITASWTPR